MTRETKIGLLVGLAFIIVIGILLSDHMAGTSDPPSAKLDAAADNVRAGIATPAPNEPPVVVAGATGANPAASPQQAPLSVPTQPVPTQQDLHAPPPQQPQPVNTVVQAQPQGTQRVEVGGPTAGGARAPIVIRDTGAHQVARGPVQVEVQNPPPAEPVDAPVTVLPENVNDNPTIADNEQSQQPAPTRRDANGRWEWTREMGEEVVSTGGGGGGGGNEPAGNGRSRNPTNTTNQKPGSGGPFEYKAETGDTLSKLAGKFLGGNTKANRELIVRANPSLKDNPDKIAVGHTYVIPAPPAQQPPSPSAPVVLVEQRQTKPTAPAAPQQQPQRRQQVAEATLGAGQSWYTVRENDSLWKIASEQLGSGNAAEKIKELNQDVLKGDTIVPGMRLRLPGKPLASAN